MPQLPKARTSDIVEMEADHELLIYDLQINKAYNLNETSKAVYQACGSNVSFEELKQRHKFTDDLIYFALDELKANDLIEGKATNHFAGLSRREVIRRVGLASMIALPVIAGIVAPMSTHAASGLLANNQPCNRGTDCASGVCTADSNFDQRCCVPTSANNFPNGPGGQFQRSSKNGCDSGAMQFCCSGMGVFTNVGAGTCTCTI